jgi:hypothetical protein
VTYNLLTAAARTSVNVYAADIFNCSRQTQPSLGRKAFCGPLSTLQGACIE